MFRSHHDTYRPAKEPEKSLTFKAHNCDMCSNGNWLSEIDVELHRKTAHLKEIREIKNNNKESFCMICMRLQDSKEDLIAHIKERHLLSSPDAQRVERMIYICEDCTHIFFNKDLLALHILSAHTNKNEKPGKYFTCPKCFKNIRLTSLWSHFQQHDIPSLSVCDICITVFGNKSELIEHVKIHKPYYKCEQTSFHTTVKEQYDDHLKALNARSIGNLRVRKLNMFKKNKLPGNFRYNIHSVRKGLCLPDFIDVCIICREICTSRKEMAIHALRDHIILPERVRYLCACGEEFEFKILLKQHVVRLKGGHEPVGSSSFQKASEIEGTSNSISIKQELGETNRRIEIELTPMSEICFATDI